MSYKIEVLADPSGEWASNALRFATHKEAERSAAMLTWRWTLVEDYRIVESDEPVNTTVDADGKHDLLPEITKELENDDKA